MRIAGIVFSVLLVFSTGAARADNFTQSQDLRRQAAEAYEKGDFAAAADLFGKARALRPDHPGLTINWAIASAKAGRADDAIAALESYARMGLIAQVLGDEDFAPLAGDPRFQAVAASLGKNAEPVGAVEPVAGIELSPFLGEGLARDEESGRWFVGDVHGRRIVAVAADGTVSDFVTAARDGLFGAFGLAVDRERRLLWVASSALAQTAGVAEDERGAAGLFAFSLDDARLVRKALLPAGSEHIIGDLTLGADGTVYATDSATPVVYRFAPDATAIEELVRSDEFRSLQGLALSPDGTRLAVSDYAAGIRVVDLATRAVVLLQAPAGATLLGTDGIYRRGGDLIGVQNGINPQRLVTVRLNADWSAIEAVEVTAANLDLLGEPTLGAVVGEDFYVIGNGQWSRFTEEGTLTDDGPFVPTLVVKLAPR